MIARLKTTLCAALPFAGLLLMPPPLVLATSYDHQCWEEGGYNRPYGDPYNDDASYERYRYRRPPYEDEEDLYPYGGRPYEDRLPPVPDRRGPYASPYGLDPSALLPSLLGSLLSGS